MYTLAGLKNIFLQALNNDLNDAPYSKLLLIERWNKECDKVYEHKNELVDEYKTKLAPKTGAWIKSECSEKDGNAICSICRHWDWDDCNYCSNCGSKNKE